MNKFDKIIIDGNNLYYKEYAVAKTSLYKEKKNLSNENILSKTIELFLISLKKIKNLYSHENTEYYFLWDNPVSKELLRCEMDISLLQRKKLDNNYKNNRIKKDDSFYQGINILRSFLTNRYNNYFDLQITLCEADDVVKGLLDYFKEKNENKNILIISSDLDWFRCIDVKNNILCLAGNTIYNDINFKEKYGYELKTSNIIMHKTLRGDSIDNIPIAIKNVKDEEIFEIIKNYENIYSLISDFRNLKFLSKLTIQKIEENKERLILNYQLVDFIPISSDSIKDNIIQGIRDEKKLKIFYESFGLDIYQYENIKRTSDNIKNFFRNNNIYQRI